MSSKKKPQFHKKSQLTLAFITHTVDIKVGICGDKIGVILHHLFRDIYPSAQPQIAKCRRICQAVQLEGGVIKNPFFGSF